MDLVSYDDSSDSDGSIDISSEASRTNDLSKFVDTSNTNLIISTRYHPADRSDTTPLVLDNVEPEFRMRVPKSARRPDQQLSSLAVSKSKSGKVLLSIPTLDDIDSSSDDDQESTARSKHPERIQHSNGQRSSKAAGLLGLLPPTRSLIVREGNRPMIPHQVFPKRTTVSTPKVPIMPVTTSRHHQQDSNEYGEESGASDNEIDFPATSTGSSSFFSFPSKDDRGSGDMTQMVSSLRSAAMAAATSSISSDKHAVRLRDPKESVPHAKVVHNLSSIDPAILAEIKQSESAKLPDDAEDANTTALESCWNSDNFVPGPERKRIRLNQPGTRVSLPVDELLATTATEIREVHQADLTAGADVELMKSVTADNSQYVSHKSRQEDDPGPLAHRKHQITWLASQAQENEFELQERWAAARRNKASSRAKYGF